MSGNIIKIPKMKFVFPDDISIKGIDISLFYISDLGLWNCQIDINNDPVHYMGLCKTPKKAIKSALGILNDHYNRSSKP